MIPGRDVIIVAWVDPEGDVQPTGRRVLHDGQWIEQFKPGPRAYAVVWSRDAVDLPGAHAYAKKNDASVFILRDTDDVLDRARAQMLLPPYQPDTTCYQTAIQQLLAEHGEDA